jgi:hypothetical protein
MSKLWEARHIEVSRGLESSNEDGLLGNLQFGASALHDFWSERHTNLGFNSTSWFTLVNPLPVTENSCALKTLQALCQRKVAFETDRSYLKGSAVPFLNGDRS